MTPIKWGPAGTGPHGPAPPQGQPNRPGMERSAQAKIRSPSVEHVPLTTLVWRPSADPTGSVTSPECGRSRFRGHQVTSTGEWHVRGFRKSCGRISCPTCHERVALKEAVKASKRLGRALPLVHQELGDAARRWSFILDPGQNPGFALGIDDWWTDRDAYLRCRTLANEVARAAGLRSWTLTFHGNDDRPDDGCPWRGHFHVLGDGDLDRSAITDRGWTVRLATPSDTSPVESLHRVLSVLSSYAHRRSIQRLTYGGLAAPNALARKGAGGGARDSTELRCSLCDREIPRGEWFRATPTQDLGPSEEGCYAVDPEAWLFEHPMESFFGRPRWGRVAT